MALVTVGIYAIIEALNGVGTPFNNDNTYIGVGTSTSPENITKTNLQGASTFRKKVDAGYPIISNNIMTCRATFAQNEANFAWNEWGIFNAASGGRMLCRKVESKGTKTSDQTWVFEVSIALA
jgi:hypothetical protein